MIQGRNTRDRSIQYDCSIQIIFYERFGISDTSTLNV